MGLDAHSRRSDVPWYAWRKAWEQRMPIEAYLPTSGASFGPEAATNMGKALEDAVDILGIGPSDETKREAVARFINLPKSTGAWMRRACAIRPLWL